MSTEGWVLAGLTAAGVILTGLLVAYNTPVGHRFAGWVRGTFTAMQQAVTRVFERIGSFVQGRRLFWMVLPLVIAGWALAIFARGDSLISTHPSTLSLVALLVAAIASGGVLAAAFRRTLSGVASPAPWAYPVVRTEGRTYLVSPANELIEVGIRQDDLSPKARDLKRQTYAYAATMLKYLHPNSEAWTRGDQVTSLNKLLDKLKAEGVDLSEFAIPLHWTRQPFSKDGDHYEYFSDELLAPRIEGLIIYLKEEQAGKTHTDT